MRGLVSALPHLEPQLGATRAGAGLMPGGAGHSRDCQLTLLTLGLGQIKAGILMTSPRGFFPAWRP